MRALLLLVVVVTSGCVHEGASPGDRVFVGAVDGAVGVSLVVGGAAGVTAVATTTVVALQNRGEVLGKSYRSGELAITLIPAATIAVAEIIVGGLLYAYGSETCIEAVNEVERHAQRGQ